MAKRKADDTSADSTVKSKKQKVAQGKGLDAGSAKRVMPPTDASTSKAPNATSAGGGKEKDVKGKRKAVDVSEEHEDDEDADMQEEESGEGGEDQDEPGEGGGAEPVVSQSKPQHRIRKLAPPRPFPTVPISVSATGPRSAHSEGKNYICVTRKTPLGAYLRRCKEVVMKDGYKTLHLNAMGAAIPHLLQLSVSLPSILPHPPEDIHTEVLTGSVEVQDEVIPDDEDEDISYRTRGKSTLSVVIKIGDGVDQVLKQTKHKAKGSNARYEKMRIESETRNRLSRQKAKQQRSAPAAPQQVVVRAEDMAQD